MEGLEVVKPMIANLMEGEFSVDDARGIQAAALEKAAEVNERLGILPTSRTPVNRPETDG